MPGARTFRYGLESGRSDAAPLIHQLEAPCVMSCAALPASVITADPAADRTPPAVDTSHVMLPGVRLPVEVRELALGILAVLASAVVQNCPASDPAAMRYR